MLGLLPPYQLVWSDEFNVPGVPDPSKWAYETGFVRNQELQIYRPENARVEKGHLIIEARREKVPNPGYVAGSSDWRTKREFADYTSAAIETKGLKSWLYGRFEMRAKIDIRKGMWPAFWTIGVDKHWPQCGEIDIMEFYSSTLLANTAWGNGKWNTVRKPISEFLDKDKKWAEKWHIWRMDWDENFIRLYVDGKLMNETDLSKTLNPDGFNPFHQPHFIILNLAVGMAGGDPSQTEFPSRYEVDWVRVYQKKS